MSDTVETITLAQVAAWLRDAAGLQVEGSEGSIALRDSSGRQALTLRSSVGGQSVSLTAHVAPLPRDEHLAALIQMQLLRLCADTHALHGLRAALTADAQQVVLLDPALRVEDAQALIERCELALEMATALGEEIHRVADEASTTVRERGEQPDSRERPHDPPRIFFP